MTDEIILTPEAEALIDAVKRNDCAAAQEHLGALESADLWLRYKSRESKTLLHLAAEEGFEEITRLIIAKDPQAVCEEDSRGGSPLTRAIEHGQYGTTKILLEAGADTRFCWARHETENARYMSKELHALVKEADKPFQLFDAVENGDAERARRLLQSGVKVDPRTRFGHTPLHKACEKDKAAVAAVLIEYGADLSALTHLGETPMWLAVYHRHHGMVEVLGKAGASVIEQSGISGTSSPLSVAQASYSNLAPELRALIFTLYDAELEKIAQNATRVGQETRPLPRLRLRKFSPG
jgi:26S proteasome non-ATPase regulatory subunit 10